MSRIALVTGGDRGLGHAVALHAAAKGIDVVITYRTGRDEAEDVVRRIEAQGRRAAMLPLDVTRFGAYPAFVAALREALAGLGAPGRFDFLVNNAGYGVMAPLAEVTEDQLDRMIDVHFKAVVLLTQALLPLMADGGRIVNVSTGLTRYAFPGAGAYAAAKGAVEVLTRYLALELGPRRITANVVAPGAVATDFGGGWLRDDPDARARLAAETALGRVAEPDDVGALVAALLTDDARWVDGQRIEVSGGIHL